MASTTISTAFVKQYGSTIYMLSELMPTPFEGKCIEEDIHAEERYFDQLGSVYAQEVIDRYGNTPQNDIDHARRRVVATPYDVGLMFDDFDKVQTLINPESQYVQRQVTALKRKKSIQFITGALGTAYSGKGGGTANAFDFANSSVAVTVGASSGNAGMNVDKLRYAQEVLLTNHINLDDPMNEAYIVMGPQQRRELLENEEVTSSDYAAVKALVNGQIDSFMGFKFIFSNLLPYINTAGTGFNLDWSATDVPTDTDTTDIRGCFAWVKSGIIQATNPEIITRVSERDDKRYNWQAYSKIRTGAVRMEEVKVLALPCDQSPQ